jgi:glycosyltransferase involved in cell wall biosynthesis
MKSAPRTPPGPLPARPTLSVVVPVYNERATVAAALDALGAKRIPGWAIEIIIVESNSTDGSREIVQG